MPVFTGMQDFEITFQGRASGPEADGRVAFNADAVKISSEFRTRGELEFAPSTASDKAVVYGVVQSQQHGHRAEPARNFSKE
jgi:hypothetical protein